MSEPVEVVEGQIKLSEPQTHIELPAMIWQGLVIMPHMAVPLELEQPAAQAAVRAAAGADNRVLLLFARSDEEATANKFHRVGVIAQVQTTSRGGTNIMIAQGLMRAEVIQTVQEEPYLRVQVEPRPDPETWDEETDILAPRGDGARRDLCRADARNPRGRDQFRSLDPDRRASRRQYGLRSGIHLRTAARSAGHI